MEGWMEGGREERREGERERCTEGATDSLSCTTTDSKCHTEFFLCSPSQGLQASANGGEEGSNKNYPQ